MRKYKLLAVLITVMFLFESCGAINQLFKETEDANLVARMALNNQIEQYFIYYDAASPETQAIWKVKIDPLIFKAVAALNIWDVALARGVGVATSEKQYIAAKNLLLDEIFNLLGVELE